MSYERKNFNELRNLNYSSKGSKFNYAGENIFTSQGFSYVNYNLNLSAQSSIIKNFTTNTLTDAKNAKDILKFEKNNFRKDLNTIFRFKPLNPLSAFSVATALTNKKDDDSILKLSTKNTSTTNGQAFLVDFLNDHYCTVTMIDGVTKKYLYREDDNVGLVFRFLDNNTIDTKALTSNYYFNYNYDEDNNYLKLRNYNKLSNTPLLYVHKDYHRLSDYTQYLPLSLPIHYYVTNLYHLLKQICLLQYNHYYNMNLLQI